MSLLSTLPLPASLHQHAWLLDRQLCILSGDGGWQVRDVDAEEKGRQGSCLLDAVPNAS